MDSVVRELSQAEKDHLVWNKRWSERVIFTIFSLLGKPSSMLDVGCGPGPMALVAHKVGVDTVAVDIQAPYPDELGGIFRQHDLTQPLDLGRVFDMILCLEVAEHIPEASARMLCDNISAHRHPNTRLIFSAALPGQIGAGHVNCQPPPYWREMLYESGRFSYMEENTAKLALLLTHTAGPLSHWLPANIQCF